MFKKIPISIHPMFWLFAALLGFFATGNIMGMVIWVVIILISVLVHEMGHALTGLAFKQQVHISLVTFGGLTSRRGPKLSLFKEFILTLNGPLAGYALAAVCYGLLYLVPTAPPLAQLTLWSFVQINLFWSTVNLLPVMPLDGGQLLRIIMEAIFGFKGTSIALLIGAVLGAALAVFFMIIGYFIAGALFFILTFESFRSWRAYKVVAPSDKDETLQQLYSQAQATMEMGHPQEAVQQFEQVRQKSGKGVIYLGATEFAARIYASQGDDKRAYEYLQSIAKNLSPSALPILQKLAYEAGDYDTVVRVGKESFDFKPNYNTAWTTACAHAARGEVRPTIGWLECALREGMPEVTAALHDGIFDQVRSDPDFQKFAQKVE